MLFWLPKNSTKREVEYSFFSVDIFGSDLDLVQDTVRKK